MDKLETISHLYGIISSAVYRTEYRSCVWNHTEYPAGSDYRVFFFLSEDGWDRLQHSLGLIQDMFFGQVVGISPLIYFAVGMLLKNGAERCLSG